MITKRFIRKNIESFCRSERDLSQFDAKNIHKILCLVDLEKCPSVKKVFNIAKSLVFHQDKVCLLCFSENKDNLESLENGMHLVSKGKEDYNMLGNPKDKKIKNILSSKYDLLINYFEDENIFILKSSISIKCSLRVGFSGIPFELNDVIFSTGMKDIEAFEKQIIKYLKLINQ